MYNYQERDSTEGCFCTLLYPYRGQTEGTVIKDMGTEVLVQLINGKETIEDKNDVLIYD